MGNGRAPSDDAHPSTREARSRRGPFRYSLRIASLPRKAGCPDSGDTEAVARPDPGIGNHRASCSSGADTDHFDAALAAAPPRTDDAHFDPASTATTSRFCRSTFPFPASRNAARSPVGFVTALPGFRSRFFPYSYFRCSSPSGTGRQGRIHQFRKLGTLRRSQR